MLIKSQKLKYFSRNRAFLILIILLITGCANTHKITRTERIVTNNNKGMIYPSGQQTTTTITTSDEQQNKKIVETSETTTTTETKAEQPGILGSTLHAIGYVISIPFIIIGGVLRTIFGG